MLTHGDRQTHRGCRTKRLKCPLQQPWLLGDILSCPAAKHEIDSTQSPVANVEISVAAGSECRHDSLVNSQIALPRVEDLVLSLQVVAEIMSRGVVFVIQVIEERSAFR